MKPTFKGVMSSAALLFAVQLSAAPETWQPVDLTAEATIIGMGELPFPDGRRGAWVGTEQGSFRQVDNGWQRWPLVEGDNPALRDILVAVDENGFTTWWLASSDGLLLTRNGEDWTRRSAADTALADNDILALHLGQSGDGQPAIWIGSQTGLTIWRMGQWESVLARSDGFQGGPVKAIRGLSHNGRRQTWVAGPTGLSRYQDGQWQRWAQACLRGHRLQAIQTIDTADGMVLMVGTDRGLRQLSLDDPKSCQPLAGPDGTVEPVRGLARDGHERLYVFTDRQVERYSPGSRASLGWGWTFFDQRDGLPASIDWRSVQRLDADGRLWAGSSQGLWRLDIAAPPGAPDRPLPLRLSDGQAIIAAGAESPLRTHQAEPTLSLLLPESDRPHALRFRLRTAPGAEFGPWQSAADLQPGPLAFGRNDVVVEMADAHGRVHGPYDFPLQRQLPALVIGVAISALLLALVLLGWMVLRRRGG